MWGYGSEGAMGNSLSPAAQPTPTEVSAIPDPVAAVSVGQGHCAAIAGVFVGRSAGHGPCSGLALRRAARGGGGGEAPRGEGPSPFPIL